MAKREMSGMSMAAPEGLFALEGRTTAQMIADQLREQIIQGAIRPGQQINESLLARQLNMSRGPLREALQRLCQEGILISRRNYGVFVLEVKTHDLREIYEVRESVESAAASRLLDGSPQQIKDTCEVLRKIVGEMAKQVATQTGRPSHGSTCSSTQPSLPAWVIPVSSGFTRHSRRNQECASSAWKSPTQGWTFWFRNTKTSWICWRRATGKVSSRPSAGTCKKPSRTSPQRSRTNLSAPQDFSCLQLPSGSPRVSGEPPVRPRFAV